MHLDLANLDASRPLRTEICVIGAGAAGISICRRLLRAGHEVTLLESGGLDYEAGAARLNQGDVVGLDYYRLEDARLRFFGGTTAIWGGRCAELDEVDFTYRSHVPGSGWPLSKRDLKSYYREAWALFGLRPIAGPAALEAARITLPAFDPKLLHTPLWMFDAEAGRFTFGSTRDLIDDPHCRVITHATVTCINAARDGNAVESLTVASPGGLQLKVEAKMFVLAAGGIENPRLLLASRSVQPEGLGNGTGLVGRYFMEHPHARGGRILDSRAWQLLKAFGRRHRIGTQDVAALITPSERLQRQAGILNTSVTIVARQPPNARQALGMRAYGSIKHKMAPTKFGRGLWIGTKKAAAFAQRHVDPLRPWLLHKAGALDVTLLVRAEQAPNPDSRVRLTNQLDAFGVPRVALNWRLSALDMHSVSVLVDTLGKELARLNLGRVEPAGWLKGDEWKFDRLVSSHAIGGYHHMGTTRMSPSPRAGVTDADGRVHGVDNLYVAGSSLFPTSGWANPTLTIVALALRTGDVISRRLRHDRHVLAAASGTGPARAVHPPAREPEIAQAAFEGPAFQRVTAGTEPARTSGMRGSRFSGFVQAFADWMIVGGIIATTVAPLILLIEIFEWLTRSEWPGLTVADGLSLFGLVHEAPETSMQRLVDLLMAIPLTIALFLVGVFMFLGGINIGDWGTKRDLETRSGLDKR